MKCFVITKKHIILVACVIVLITCIAVIKFRKSEKTVSAFKESPPTSAMSDVLPTLDEPSVIAHLKDFAKSKISKEPNMIIESYGGLFENVPMPQKTAAPSATETSAPTPSPTPIPTKEQTNTSAKELNNDTAYEVDLGAFSNEPLGFDKNTCVLIIHTHTTECYTPEIPTSINDTGRSTDETRNMIAVGEILKGELEKYGLTVIHDKTVHDYPSYQNAYGRSLTTVKKHISANENIGIVLDIHRDAIANPDGTRIKLVHDINGEKMAQMMIVCGTDGTGLSHPDWTSNLNFAFKIQELADKTYPGLMRPINLRKERFNQHLTPGSLILEIGTHGNSLDEAKRGATVLGQIIGKVITKNGT